MAHDFCVPGFGGIVAGLIGADGQALPRQLPAAPLPVLADLQGLGALVDRQLAACRRNSTQLAVLVLHIEDAVPPALFHAMSERLRGHLRATDLIFQIGEQAFGVVLLGIGRSHVSNVQRRLLRALDGAYGVGDELGNASVRIGVAAHPQPGISGAELVRAATPSAN